MSTTYRAVIARQPGPAALSEWHSEDLPDGDVTIDVHFSSLNYKDGLSVTGTGRIARSFPMVAGADLAGIVVRSETSDFAPGDQVLVTGWGLSETHPGGYTQRQRVRSEWITRVPSALDLSRTMAIGTAGLTAMLCLMALERAGVRPADGPVLVTGAAGGVGNVALMLLHHHGFSVSASTGRAGLADRLRELGATEVVERQTLSSSGRALESERWAGAIDTVGGVTLASVLARIRYGGAVAACGMAGGTDLPATVFPFILRGVRLLGVDSVRADRDIREQAWHRLAAELDLDVLDSITQVAPMSDIVELASSIVAGAVTGRVVIDVNR